MRLDGKVYYGWQRTDLLGAIANMGTRGHHSQRCCVPPHLVPAHGVDITNGHPSSTDAGNRLSTSLGPTSQAEALRRAQLRLHHASGLISEFSMPFDEASIPMFLVQKCTDSIPALHLVCTPALAASWGYIATMRAQMTLLHVPVPQEYQAVVQRRVC